MVENHAKSQEYQEVIERTRPEIDAAKELADREHQRSIELRAAADAEHQRFVKVLKELEELRNELPDTL